MSEELLSFEEKLVKRRIAHPTPIDKEVVWDKSETILSKTDRYGIIEYANEAFINVSGYEDFELIGQPHSVIRHPDMPKAIFKVLWDNLLAGNNFHAVAKNLAKSGRYYWVVTDFDIIKNDKGEITNFYARRKSLPTDAITKHIEPLYKRLLAIEKTAGMKASEKYLYGFLEDMGVGYIEWIQTVIAEAMPKVEKPTPEVVAKKGFFSSFFGR